MWRVVGYSLRLATSNDEQVAGEAYHVRKADEAAPDPHGALRHGGKDQGGVETWCR